MVGSVVYPDPGFVICTERSIKVLGSIVARPVAPEPPPPVKTTVGATEYCPSFVGVTMAPALYPAPPSTILIKLKPFPSII